MAARKKSTSPNPILFWKPNQFPKGRIGRIFWNKPAPENNATEDEELDDDARREQEYLDNRFKSTNPGGSDGPTGPCGCGTR